VTEIVHTSVQLVNTFFTLLLAIGALALAHALLIVWVAWWLWGVNWNKAWATLAQGGWAVVVLLTIIAALAWASLAPSSLDCWGLLSIANFWWQLGAVTLLVLLALFCGWVQTVFGWAPAEIELAPPAPTEDHHHGH
jgi:hypothetical protein